MNDFFRSASDMTEIGVSPPKLPPTYYELKLVQPWFALSFFLDCQLRLEKD